MGLMLGAIQATLSIDNGGFKRGLLEAQAVTSTFGQTFSTAVVSPVLAGVQVLTRFAGAIAASSERLLSMAESAARLSNQTGVTVETIQSLRNALSDMGLSAEGADALITAFTRKLGDAKKDGGALAQNLARLGVDLRTVGTGEAALRSVFDQLSKISDAGVRAAAAAEIFDRQFGAAALAVIDGSKGIDQLNRDFIALGRTLTSQQIEALAQIDDRLDRIKGAGEGVRNVLTREFLSGLVSGVGQTDAQVNNLARTIATDLAPAAKELGQLIGEASEGFAELIRLLKEFNDAIGGETVTPQGYKSPFPFFVSVRDGIGNVLYGNFGKSRELYGRDLYDVTRQKLGVSR